MFVQCPLFESGEIEKADQGGILLGWLRRCVYDLRVQLRCTNILRLDNCHLSEMLSKL